MEFKWYYLMLIVVAIVFGVGYVFHTNAETEVVKACVNSQGDWTDINPGYSVNMGCVHNRKD